MGIDDAQLYKLLSELDYLSVDDLKKAQTQAQAEGVSLYEELIKRDLISDENLGKLVAYSLQLPFVTLGQSTIPPDILKIVPESVAEAHGVITYALDDQGLKIATSNHVQVELFEMLAKKAGVKKYRVFLATDRDIENALHQYKKEIGLEFGALLQSKAGVDIPVAKIVDTIIEYASNALASDIHIEPTRAISQVRFRIDGVLQDAVQLPRSLHDQVVTRIKVMSRLRTDEHFSAQDGRMRVGLGTPEEKDDVDVRVSIVPITSGEKVVMRLLSSHNRQFSLTDLGMGETDLKKVRNGFMRPYGMVLSTGPTGSGKTTSMYAILKILNTREKNIATIEDPVEYELIGINQIQVNTKANLTFANGLRSILRQDPDIMYVGEIRDEETADIAINSALTGHLVLSTLHTNDAVTALPRLIDMKVEPFLVASTVNVIIGQRLVRKICSNCKVSVELTRDKSGWKGDVKLAAQFASVNPKMIAKYFGSTASVRVYQGKGCNVCHNTGYIGRVGIFEVLEVSPKMQALISQKANAVDMQQQAIADGMTTMMDDGLRKVQNGVTTLEEVVRVTRE